MLIRYLAALALVAPLVAAPAALASDATPECEPDQPGVGYTSTESFWSAVDALVAPARLGACEGEHWDGQDPVRADEPPCGPATDGATLESGFVALCQGTDPNAGPSEPAPGVFLVPATARASWAGNEGAFEVYVATNVALVGRAAVHHAHCAASACGGGTAQSQDAVYLRDNTPYNLLCVVVQALGVTRGYCDERDCTHDEYQYEALTESRPGYCGRDNTAVTAHAALP